MSMHSRMLILNTTFVIEITSKQRYLWSRMMSKKTSFWILTLTLLLATLILFINKSQISSFEKWLHSSLYEIWILFNINAKTTLFYSFILQILILITSLSKHLSSERYILSKISRSTCLSITILLFLKTFWSTSRNKRLLFVIVMSQFLSKYVQKSFAFKFAQYMRKKSSWYFFERSLSLSLTI